MGSAFHQLCPRYSGTLTPTAPMAIRLWETFTFFLLNVRRYCSCKSKSREQDLMLSITELETMSLCEMGPQLKLPTNIMKGSMPLQCNIYFPQTLAI